MTALPLSLAEYLATEYEPECEYIDGSLEDRNGGKSKHSQTQGLLIGWFLANTKGLRMNVRPEQRVRVSPSRVRIPDVCLVPTDDRDEIVSQPPALRVEILSPEDRWSRVQVKLRDLQKFGVPTIWIIDPYSGEAWTAGAGVPVAQIEDGILRCEPLALELPLIEILAE